MIKIIKAGTKKKINCEECGSFLSYEEEDIVTSLDRNAVPTRYIICPVCKRRIFLSQTKVPKFANGSVLNQRTLILEGEYGPEAIIPLQNNTEWTGQVASLLADALIPFLGGSGSGGQNVSLEIDGVQFQKCCLEKFKHLNK